MAHENLHIKVEIEIAGHSKKLENISSLMLVQRTDWHHQFEVRMPLDTIEGERANNISSSQNHVGKEIKIVLKPQTGSGELNFFKGIITSVSLSRFSGAASELQIKGYSNSILLDDGPGCSSHLEKSLKQIFTTLHSKYPVNLIKLKNNPTADPTLPFIAQYNESTYDFMCRLAERYGQWFFYNGTELVLGQPERNQSSELYFGHDLERFELSIKVAPLKFQIKTYDYTEKQQLSSTSSASISGIDNWGNTAVGNSDSLYNNQSVIHSEVSVIDAADLDIRAEATKSARVAEQVIFQGVSDNPRLKPGTIVHVQGAGIANLSSDKTDYGRFIITTVTHQTDGLGNYNNSFEAIPSELQVPPAFTHITNPTPGQQAAIVLDNNDPDKLGRIKVRLYWQGDNESTPWIRYMTSHAGDKRGLYALPEVDDEVIVAFENGLIDMPYVIGSMYNGKDNSDDRHNEDNDIKTWRTRSGNEIQFLDKADEEHIHLINKAEGHELLITMKDGGLIKILSKKDIEIEAAENINVKSKNMKFEATETIEFKCKEYKLGATDLINLESNKDFQQKGMDVAVEAANGFKMNANANAELKANASIEVSGNAKATVKASGQLELSGSGMASLKGGVVMIN